MEIIKDKEYGGERPLFASRNLELENVTIHAGESALKKCENVKALNCRFEGKYPFWHCKRFLLENCTFTEGGRAAIWYSGQCEMRNCVVEAPKMFREMRGIKVEDTDFPNGEEMLWDCDDVRLNNVKINNCDYLFSHSANIDIDRYEQHGNYSFQYCENVRIRNSKIYSKDAFWNTKNVTIEDSVLDGEYLAWYSEGLTLINCHISGTQPLCYCRNLKLINCTMDASADLAFEESDVKAEIIGDVTSVKNPRHGEITARRIKDLILDRNLMTDSDVLVIQSAL